LPLFPFATVHFQTLLLIVALVSIFWATAEAFTTPDARLVVAYSSVAQLSFITLGIFSLQPQGSQGALFQMLNHGLVTALLFFIGSMHNRVAPKVASREIGLSDAIVIVPIVLVILALAFYPQFGLRRSELSAKAAIAPARTVQALSAAAPRRVAER